MEYDLYVSDIIVMDWGDLCFYVWSLIFYEVISILYICLLTNIYVLHVFELFVEIVINVEELLGVKLKYVCLIICLFGFYEKSIYFIWIFDHVQLSLEDGSDMWQRRGMYYALFSSRYYCNVMQSGSGFSLCSL